MSQSSVASSGGRGRGRPGYQRRGGRGWSRGGRGHYGRGRGQGYHGNRGGPPHHGPSQTRPAFQPTLVDIVPSPYKGWKFYFPTEAYSDHSPIVLRTQVFEKYFISWRDLYNAADIEDKGFFTITFKELLSDEGICDGLPNFASELKTMPETVLSCLGLAMHQVLTHKLEEEHRRQTEMVGVTPSTSQPMPVVALVHTVPHLQCSVTGFEPVTSLKSLKANYYGKFVSLKGTVVRVSNIKPLCTRMAFECNTCGTLQAILLPDGKYALPGKCPAEECRSKGFTPRRSHPLTETIDWQTIRVQEIINDDHREAGRIPRTVDCELTNHLESSKLSFKNPGSWGCPFYFCKVDSCVPGDMITVSGIVKVMSSDEGRSKQKDKCMFLLYIHANSVVNAKGSKCGGGGDQTLGGLAVEFNMKELYAIEEIQSEPNLFRLVVGSLCPTIYGHEMVKAGLVLGLLGGTHKFVNDKNRIPVRGDPHVLVVGDPGLGKSQMLQAVANVAPRSVYVCGNTTTTSGLTVTLCKEGHGSGDYALEAGALVLADQGCCCIDEFDKMGSQHQALLEAMEQQSISIAKAGIVCSLPARTSIIAAANPVGGHYNKAKTVSENLRMGSALLSRFDLVFILLDKPDEELDSMLSEHVMALHAGKKARVTGTPVLKPQTAEEEEAKARYMAEKPLSERLKVPRAEPIDPIPPQLLRKYVAYARKYVHPTIGPEPAKVLQDFYLELRKKHQTQDSTPITTRQLESLIRLAEARARLELREEVTTQDAADVVHIMKYSMMDTFTDELGFLDFQRSQHGSGMSSRSRAKKFIGILQRRTEQTYNALFTVQEMRQIAKDAAIQVRDFEDFILSLNNQGYLLKKGPRVYQLQTAGY